MGLDFTFNSIGVNRDFVFLSQQAADSIKRDHIKRRLLYLHISDLHKILF